MRGQPGVGSAQAPAGLERTVRAFGLSPEPELCVPELFSFLGIGTSARLRSHSQSFLHVSGPLDFLHPSLQPGQLASPRRGPTGHTCHLGRRTGPREHRNGRQLARRWGGEHVLWAGGPGFECRLAEPYPGGLWPLCEMGVGVAFALSAPGAASGPSGVERVHADPSTRQCPHGPRKESLLHPLLWSPPGSWPVGPSFAWPRTWKLEMAEFFAGPLGLACVRG